jgi:hypothetical protein
VGILSNECASGCIRHIGSHKAHAPRIPIITEYRVS